ncbi:MAG: dTDP-4-dehydrorhamnose reductase [Anaerolineales bacterium]|nr:dTDP-4-dehydrorhamnose reductase [Anaerolineales bacterium]NUQ86661.1 dTDP-4-dehydrorhamnose reductase [Anaerolineales bacterium]
MNILLLGKNGQLGSEFQKILPKLGTTTFLDYEELDLRDLQALEQVMNDLKPNLIVNASAYTAVDRAETEQETAMKVNALAPGVMAEVARKIRAVLIHYSTDYVFDGKKDAPYTENDATHPLNIYGRSKLEGEENIRQVGGAYLILRTSWVYSMQGDSFVNKVLGWARKNKNLKIVNDQISNPTWACELAKATYLILTRYKTNLIEEIGERHGVYHLAGGGHASRYEWARQILANDPNRTEQLVQTLEPVSSGEFPTPATRPLFSALDCSKIAKTFDIRLPDWRVSLQKAMSE